MKISHIQWDIGLWSFCPFSYKSYIISQNQLLEKLIVFWIVYDISYPKPRSFLSLDKKRWMKIEFENLDQKIKIDFSSMLSKWNFEKMVFLDRKWEVLLPKFPRKISKILEIREVKGTIDKDAFCSLCHMPGNFAELKTQKVKNEGGIFPKSFAPRISKIKISFLGNRASNFMKLRKRSYEQNTSL